MRARGPLPRGSVPIFDFLSDLQKRSSLPPLSEFARLPELAFVRLANHVLAQEPWGRTQLEAHVGQVLSASVPGGTVLLRVAEGGFIEPAPKDAAPHVTLEWTPEPGAGSWKQGIRLEGDAEFAQTIQRVVSNLRWDLEEDLSKFVGDIAARRLVDTAAGAARESRRIAERLAGQVVEYLVEENPQLVANPQIDTLASAVRALRDDLARLEKRIGHLAART